MLIIVTVILCFIHLHLSNFEKRKKRLRRSPDMGKNSDAPKHKLRLVPWTYLQRNRSMIGILENVSTRSLRGNGDRNHVVQNVLAKPEQVHSDVIQNGGVHNGLIQNGVVQKDVVSRDHKRDKMRDKRMDDIDKANHVKVVNEVKDNTEKTVNKENSHANRNADRKIANTIESADKNTESMKKRNKQNDQSNQPTESSQKQIRKTDTNGTNSPKLNRKTSIPNSNGDARRSSLHPRSISGITSQAMEEENSRNNSRSSSSSRHLTTTTRTPTKADTERDENGIPRRISNFSNISLM